MASNVGFQRVRNPHDLPTYQKRLRHLRSIAVRNLVCNTYRGIEITRMQTFFSLHRDGTTKAFYTSEKTTGSVNPTWKSFDISRYEKNINLKFKCMVLRVWVSLEDKFHLLIELNVHFSGLIYFADKLQQSGIKYNPNTVIFGMFDKFFISADESKLYPEFQTQLSEVQGVSADNTSFVLKVDQSSIRGSYTANSVSRIQTILRATKQTQATVHKIHSSIEDRLLSSQETAQKLSERERLVMKVSQLRSELMWQTSKLHVAKDKYEKTKGDNALKVSNFLEQESNLKKSRNHHEEKKKSYVQTRECLVKENAQLLIRRKQLVGEMAAYIYPITENKKKQICICGVHLPNAEDYQGHDEVMIAVALGYTCHLTMMISQFLDLPLRYQLEHRGSRAQIRDHIHTKLADKDRDFPLYGKGKEKFQFNYGVFLLNKNISQIRFSWGLGTNDLRLTLQNVKSLLELRLGVKPDGFSTRSLTPTSGTGNSIASSTARDSTRSIAGSSSASSLVRKDDIITSQTFDTSNNADKGNVLDSENKENRENNDKKVDKFDEKKDKFDEKETLFEGNDDEFFKVGSPSLNNVNIDTSLEDVDKDMMQSSSDALIDQDEKLNDMEALKASLHIHFDNSDGTSSPSVSYDEADVSSGEERHLQNKDGNHKTSSDKSLNSVKGSSIDSELPESTIKTSAFRTKVEKDGESSLETSLSDDYKATATVLS